MKQNLHQPIDCQQIACPLRGLQRDSNFNRRYRQSRQAVQMLKADLRKATHKASGVSRSWCWDAKWREFCLIRKIFIRLSGNNRGRFFEYFKLIAKADLLVGFVWFYEGLDGGAFKASRSDLAPSWFVAHSIALSLAHAMGVGSSSSAIVNEGQHWSRSMTSAKRSRYKDSASITLAEKQWKAPGDACMKKKGTGSL